MLIHKPGDGILQKCLTNGSCFSQSTHEGHHLRVKICFCKLTGYVHICIISDFSPNFFILALLVKKEPK